MPGHLEATQRSSQRLAGTHSVHELTSMCQCRHSYLHWA